MAGTCLWAVGTCGMVDFVSAKCYDFFIHKDSGRIETRGTLAERCKKLAEENRSMMTTLKFKRAIAHVDLREPVLIRIYEIEEKVRLKLIETIKEVDDGEAKDEWR